MTCRDHKINQQGFAILYAAILTSVVLVAGLGIATIVTRQIILGGIQKSSELAYYAANAGIECARYMDHDYNRFGTSDGTLINAPTPAAISLKDTNGTLIDVPANSVYCNGHTIAFTKTGDYGQGPVSMKFSLNGLESGSCSIVVVDKTISGTTVTSHGYDSDCASGRSPTSSRSVEKIRVINY